MVKLADSNQYQELPGISELYTQLNKIYESLCIKNGCTGDSGGMDCPCFRNGLISKVSSTEKLSREQRKRKKIIL